MFFLTEYVNLWRDDNVLFSSTVAQTIMVDRQPSAAALIRCDIYGGEDNSGEILVTGLVSGVTTSESLVHTSASPIQETTLQFTSITSLTTNGFITESPTPSIDILALHPTGEPMNNDRLLQADVPMEIRNRRRGMNLDVPGNIAEEDIVAIAEGNLTVVENDYIVRGTVGESRSYLIEHVDKAAVGLHSHKELTLRRIP